MLLSGSTIALNWVVVSRKAQIAAQYGELASIYGWTFALLWFGSVITIGGIAYMVWWTCKLYGD